MIELSGLSDADRRAYVLADNKLALNAGWDDALLAAEVADFNALGVDLGLAGFEAAEIDSLLAGESASAFPDEARPRLRRPSPAWATCGAWASTASCAGTRPRSRTCAVPSTALRYRRMLEMTVGVRRQRLELVG